MAVAEEEQERISSCDGKRIFRENVLQRKKPSLLFEIIPPASNTPQETVSCSTAELHSIIKHLPIDGINIPEIHDEKREGGRKISFVPKMEPRVYGMAVENALHGRVETVINRCSVRFTRKEQESWLQSTWSDFRIRNIVIVGGELPPESYEGPSVTEMSSAICTGFNKGLNPKDYLACSQPAGFFCGGITIPGREKEAERLAAKGSSGIEFFTSQVIYEAGSVKRLLMDYSEHAKENRLETKRIFLSFAPVSCRKDVNFLKWLGVIVPLSTEKSLLSEAENRICLKSFEETGSILSDILEFRELHGMDIPLGINVEHIMRHNLEASVELASILWGILKDY